MNADQEAEAVARQATMQFAFNDVAHNLGLFRKALTANGFTRDEAMEICLEWFSHMFHFGPPQ